MDRVNVERLVKLAPDLVYILDAEGRFVFVGGNCRKLVGYPAQDLIGKHFTEIIWPEDVEKARWRFNERRTGKRATRGHRIRLLTTKGQRRDFDVRYRVVQLGSCGIWAKVSSGAEKEFYGTYGIARDVTAYVRLEGNLKASYRRVVKELEHKRMISRLLIDLLDSEREKIAEDLHDSIGNALVYVKMTVEDLRVRSDLKPEERDLGIETVIEKTVQAMKDLRRIVYGLTPVTPRIMDIALSLQSLFEEAEARTGVRIHFHHQDIPTSIDQPKKIAFFRIAQEALANVVKHAGAHEIHISLIRKDGILCLSVEDDGVGFDVRGKRESIEKPRLGLTIMEERVARLGGELVIESSPGKGTHLLAQIPFEGTTP